ATRSGTTPEPKRQHLVDDTTLIRLARRYLLGQFDSIVESKPERTARGIDSLTIVLGSILAQRVVVLECEPQRVDHGVTARALRRDAGDLLVRFAVRSGLVRIFVVRTGQRDIDTWRWW